MKIFNTIEKGKFLNYHLPDKSIETLLSKLYFFGDTVIKRYKHVNAFYGNMAEKTFRKKFHKDDFFWNNYMAPEIYLKLVGIKEVDGVYIETDLNEADDYYIEMAKIDDSQNLTKSLTDNTASPELLKEITAVMVEKLRKLSKDQKDSLIHISKKGWQKLFDENMDDLREWAYMSEKHIPKETSDATVSFISEQVKKEDYLSNFNDDALSVSIDNNCDNLLVLNGKASFIDIMPPKENWKIVDEFFIITRTAVDAYVLGNEELGDAVYEEYQKYNNKIPQAISWSYEIRGALLQASYRYLINQKERAQKYMDFIEDRIEKLEKIKKQS